MNRLQMCLANNMKRYRKVKGFSQEKLAEQAGASANYIALIECGKNFPSLKMLDKIADALEVDSLDLFDKKILYYTTTERLRQSLERRIQEVISDVFEDID